MFLRAEEICCVCSFKMKMGVKLKAEYGAVLHMPVLKEGKDRVPQHPGSMQSYTQPGHHSTQLSRFRMIILGGCLRMLPRTSTLVETNNDINILCAC